MTEETKTSDIDSTAKSFGMIYKFADALHDAFHEEHRYLRNFAVFIKKTGESQNKASMERIVDAFSKFSIKNRDAIEERDFEKFVSEVIEIGKKDGPKMNKVKKGTVYYSPPAWFPLYELFSKCQEEMMGEVAFTMWKYILLIAHLTDPDSNAKEILHSLPKTAGEDFLTKQYIKIQEKADPANPMATLGNIFQGGAINELLAGIATNNIQPDKVQGALSGMVGSIKDTINAAENDNPGMSKKLNKVKGLLDTLPELIGSLTGNDDQDEPDIDRVTGPAIDLLKDISRKEITDTPQTLDLDDSVQVLNDTSQVLPEEPEAHEIST